MQKELCQSAASRTQPSKFVRWHGFESTETPPGDAWSTTSSALWLQWPAASSHQRGTPSSRPSIPLPVKETTWDRLTGPKLFKTVKRTEGIHAVPLVPLRVIAGILMIHHGSEGGFWPANYGTPGFDGFVTYVLQPYFSFLPGSLEWSAIHDCGVLGRRAPGSSVS